jgi:hypothetical protein
MTATTEPAASAKKHVLLIGLDPKVVDFAAVPGMTEERLAAGLRTALEQVRAAGFDAEWCLTDVAWESASAAIAERLRAHDYAAVMIGAGIRTIPSQFLLFERIVNLVHEAAPGARLCFNTSPESTPDAVLRWVQP